MKQLFLISFCLVILQVKGQSPLLKYEQSSGDFIDSTLSISSSCSKSYFSYFYGYKAKYPQSSATILKNTKVFLSNKDISLAGSGYITFKFLIDCEGKISYVKVLQTDEKYQAKKFDKVAVSTLYDFLKTLDQWKIAKYNDKIPINYIAFIAFKIQNGEIINIIP